MVYSHLSKMTNEVFLWITVAVLASAALSAALIVYKQKFCSGNTFPVMLSVCVFAGIFMLAVFLSGSETGGFRNVTNETLMYLVVSAVLFSGFLLCFDAACKRSALGRTVAVQCLSPCLFLIAGTVTGVTSLRLLGSVSIVAVLSGIVLLCLESEKTKRKGWLPFSCGALLLLTAKILFDFWILTPERIAPSAGTALQMLLSAMILTGVAYLSGSFSSFKKACVAGGPYVVLVGILATVFLVLLEWMRAEGALKEYKLVFVACVPALILIERIVGKGKKKADLSMIFGLFLTVAGLMGVLMSI